MPFKHIPVFARWQWLNSAQIVELLERVAPTPPVRGRKGYPRSVLIRWLLYKQAMNCTYRDLESMSGIDYSTFIKFRARLRASHWFEKLCQALSEAAVSERKALELIMDSSFVPTYSGHAENGSAFHGLYEQHGFKVHQIIDFATRLPVFQAVSPGSLHDVRAAKQIIPLLPKHWPVKYFLADKGYDSEQFVKQIMKQWKGAWASIPLRRTCQAARQCQRQETIMNRLLKAAGRSLHPKIYHKRTTIERYFSRKKNIFHLGLERTRHLKNFMTNCFTTALMEILEWVSRQPRAVYW